MGEVSRMLSLLALWQTVGEGEPTLSFGVEVIGLVSAMVDRSPVTIAAC